MKNFFELRTEAVKSADKKPEKYVDPEGKTKVRMVPADKKVVDEKTLTPAEKKKREEIAQAIARDNPDMPMDKKMAIATAQAKKVAEAKDPNEYDNEGDMAKTQLRAIIKDAEHMIEMFADDENLPEWVQNKITKAQDYLNSAHTYMMNNGDDEEDMNEQFVKTTPGHLTKTADRIGAKFDSKKQAYFKNGVKIGHVTSTSTQGVGGLSGRTKQTHYIHKKLKEEVSLDEDISKMSHGRLKWHMNTGVPHGSYSNAEMKAERDRRMKHRDSADAYKKAKPGLSEETVDEAMTASQHRMAMIDKIKKSGAVKSGSMSQNEAAPKMKGDSFKQERDRARAHDAAMGRTATGRKKPVRQMTSTQRSLAQLQRPSKK